MFQRFLNRFGWIGLIRVLCYPLTLLVTTPVRLAQTLWTCRVLADGKWEYYNRFTAQNGINSLTYWTGALNLYRYGRSGVSPYLGLGNYKLSQWFFYSLPSLFAYWRLAPITPLVGLFGWLLVHAIWTEQVSSWWLLLIMGLALISTSFYGNTFVYQNYNALGWLFFPLGLYGLLNERWLIASLAWLAASFGSFTTVFVASILSITVAVYSLSLWPLLAIFPAGIKLLTHFLPAFAIGNWRKDMVRIMKAIGMTKKSTRYKRVGHKLVIGEVYYLLLYGQFIVVVYWLTNQLSVLLLVGVLLFLLNSTRIMRFADHQSIYMMMMSLATAVTIQSQQPWLLPSYWFLMSPLPRFMGLPANSLVLDIVPKYAPFSLKNLFEGMERFLQPVQSGQRVFMAFDNPNGLYDKVFDGYGTLLELSSYVATKREILLMPNWWGVFELNYEGAPELWGRDVGSVLKNIEYWNADYVIVYQETGTKLDPKWLEAGFAVIEKFSWADYARDLRDGKFSLAVPIPDWWLLRTPQKVK